MGTHTKTASQQIISTPSSKLLVVGSLLTIYLVWGSTYLGARIAVETIPPFMLTGIRTVVSALILLAIMILRGAALPSFTESRNAFIIGGMMFGGGAGLVAFAVQWVASGLAALAVAAVPIWAALFSGIWGRWPGNLEWAGLAVGFLGIILLNSENSMQSNPIGAIALMIGPAIWAFASMWSKRLTLPSGLMGTVFQLFGGGGVLMVMSLVAGEHWITPSTRSFTAMIYLTIFGTLFGFTAYMYLVRNVRPVLATSYAYVNPIFAVFLGVVLGAETVTQTGLAAMLVILTGVGLLAFGKERTS